VVIRTEPDDLAEAVWAVARRLRHATHETLAPHGITPAQARALGVLSRHGSMRLSELSEHLRIAPRSATEVADHLEERGLVQRAADPGDRRATILSLSDQGRRTADDVAAARRAEATAFFGSLSTQERSELGGLLRRLLDPPTSP
jgi:DNA-binding MarR family transcriptional regulator